MRRHPPSAIEEARRRADAGEIDTRHECGAEIKVPTGVLRCVRCKGHLGPHYPGLIEVREVRPVHGRYPASPTRFVLVLACGHETEPKVASHPAVRAVMFCEGMTANNRGRVRTRCKVCTPLWPPFAIKGGA